MSNSRRKIVITGAIGAIVVVALTIFLIALPSVELRTFYGKDMEPTLYEGDRIVVTKQIEQLRRGDIVIFLYPGDHSQSFIKRIVGLPGEIIEINNGEVLINGQALQENYLDSQLNRFPHHASPQKIPTGKFYVMGDNRDNSNDSRAWGPLPKEIIQSKMIFNF